ncbi:MAG: tetratricopeptide repeat protein [Candidatus Hydrogenedentes bacterium]|nr:tetratricopeptide repeat protein [Candidatus Hydrogenedentota bacterium]
MAFFCAGADAAGSFRQQLEKGNGLLREGNASGALEQYRELLTEDPESPLVHYNMGLAHYGEASQFGGLGSTEDAVAALSKAKEEFENVEKNSRDPQLRVDAAYNHANATAQQAKWSAEAAKTGAGKFEDTVKSFEASVGEYEELLKREPDHAGAKQNLDHMRYLLKSMLQNPPPPQDQQQQGQNGENQEQSEDKQKQDQQGQDQQKQDQQGQDQQKQDQQKQEAQAEQQQAAKAEKDPQQDQQDQAQNSDNLPEGNTEALLESLEETDKREQREVKNPQRGNPAQGNWW